MDVLAPLVCFLIFLAAQCGSEVLPFRNTSLSREERVGDLLSRLDLDELTEQLLYGGAGDAHGPAPPIPRLGIGPYQWRSECLHGYGFDGDATSFPQAISMAATFDKDLIHAVANATAYEARAKYNTYVRAGEYQDHKGINCFSPVVNLLRHPLWGRNQETLGEDPFLSGELSKAFVRGLSALPSRGLLPRKLVEEDHIYLTAACCKHFAVHSGPENLPVSRLSFEANVSAADLWLTFLPAFRGCLADGVAQSVMCSYNGINGVPNCANPLLLKRILREMWGFKGFVISDEGALQFLVSEHRAFSTYLEAAKAAFDAGVNIENSQEIARGVYSSLPLLVAAGIIRRYQLEEMNRPLFLTRMRQGEFDPPESNPYSSLSKDDFIQSPKHRQLSLVAGCRSTVLLKNTNRFLPFSKRVRNLALIGPFAKRMDELTGSYSASRMPQYETTLEEGLKEVADVLYTLEFCNNGARCTSGDEAGLIKLLNSTKAKMPNAIVVTLGTGSTLVTESQDARSLQLFGQQQRMLELISIHAPSVPVVVFVYSAGPVNISAAIVSPQVQSILWFGYPGQEAGRIAARMLLGNPGAPYYPEGVPTSLYSGIDSLTTTAGLDRHWGYWWLPAGRLPFTWYASLSNLPAITDYEISNYTYRFNSLHVCLRNNTTCQEVAFPFGYGLSYNYAPSIGGGFAYRNLDLPVLTVSAPIGFTFTVEVVNRGVLSSEEVVQVYLDWLTLFGTKVEDNFDGRYKAASRQLVGFERLSLFAGEVRKVRFVVVPEQLKVWSYMTKTQSQLCLANMRNNNNCGGPVAASGTVRLSIGGQQPFQAKEVNSNVIVAMLVVIDH
ncbi:beta D xylosidase 2 [Echinococcus multilocularis]|uniref:Beta D xylosidase 2 n=1 Tax=Echinococcus multilocularis TaxID=6211 RepID=A0A068Y8R3_ECHMU|nr:beta D xylosidase 2 [Echinococcus multilocularis]